MVQDIPTYIVGMCKVYCAVNQIKHCSKEQTFKTKTKKNEWMFVWNSFDGILLIFLTMREIERKIYPWKS